MILIKNISVEDTTFGLVKFKEENELNNFIKIIYNLNRNRILAVLPVIKLYKIDEKDIIDITEQRDEEGELPSDIFCRDNIIFMDDRVYYLDKDWKEDLDLVRIYEESLIKASF